MRQHYKKLFYDKEKLYLLINLRINGLAYTSLASVFACDISSVRHQCDKYHIIPFGETYSLERIATDVLNYLNAELTGGDLHKDQPSSQEWYVFNGKKYSLGKTYKDYLAETERRSRYPHRKLSWY